MPVQPVGTGPSDPKDINTATQRSGINRKVWVVNSFHLPYTEEFRGKTITVPPNNVKEVQMGYLAAEKFLSQGKPAATRLPNGEYEGMPKALRIVEMEDFNPEEIEATEDHACMLCTFVGETEAGLKRHVTVKHPGEAPIEKK